ncbi:MAG: thiamine pyrophosphate-dependent dehydrogenase E1 component subunit alpha [Deltaproteobacteria bacterium]|nr:thiamine pyrophosphate-dependent dehydrogenase E1 component subunit alpha [Deltaproteobacteria bacterium]
MARYKYQGLGYQGMEKLDLPPDLLVSMFFSMLRIRMVEEAVEAKYPEDQMKTPIHLVIGQEAAAVGSAFALNKEDYSLISHRTHGNYLARGSDLNAMIAEFFCKVTGCAGGKGGSMHLFDKNAGVVFASSICAGSIPVATGMALSSMMKNEKRTTVAYFGDGAAEEGVLWESLNFAVLKKLPIIYFCENNFYSVQTPLYKRQPDGVHLFEKARGFGVPSETVDGNNVIKVYEAVRKASLRAKQGGGPSFIEAVLYRWRAHGGAGDDSKTGYRDVAEREHWQQVCPIELFYRYLLSRGLLDPEKRETMRAKIDKEIVGAFKFAENSPLPEERDLYRYVYAE